MVSGNVSEMTIPAQQLAAPLGFNIIMFVAMFAISVLFSAAMLWLVLKYFHPKRNALKSALLTALITNVVSSVLFIFVARLLKFVLEQHFFSSRVFSVFASTAVWAVVLAVNLAVAVKVYKLPMRELFYAVLVWTLLLMVVGNIALPFVAYGVERLVILFFPVQAYIQI